MPLTATDRKFLKRMTAVARDSTCLRAKIGALIVKNGKVLVAADNSPHQCYDCSKIGCIRDIEKLPSGHRREICYGICAEQRALTTAAKKGITVKGATIYCTSHPCRICEGLIAESGIKRVIFIKGYPDVIPIYDTLKDYKLEVIQAPEEDRWPREASTI